MKNSTKTLIPLIATIGVLITILFDNHSTGLLITLFYTPLIIVYVLIAFKSDLKNVQTKFKTQFLSIATFNTIVLLIYSLFKTMHWTFIGLLLTFGTFICIVTLCVGLVYFFVNRKQLASNLTYELSIIIFPAIIFKWSIIPYNYPPQLYDEYIELISESTNNLKIANNELDENNCQLEKLIKIKELKAEIVERSGGNENNKLLEFYGRSCKNYIERKKELIKNLDIKSNLK